MLTLKSGIDFAYRGRCEANPEEITDSTSTDENRRSIQADGHIEWLPHVAALGEAVRTSD